MTDELDFGNLLLIEIPFNYREKSYILREANGFAARQFNNSKISRVKFQDGKASGLRDMGDLPNILLRLCITDIQTGVQVTAAEIDEWPAKMVDKLYQKALEISGLKDDTDSTQVKLAEALQRDDSPISITKLREWSDSLPPQFKVVKDLLEPTPEEKAKNEQSSTTDGLE